MAEAKVLIQHKCWLEKRDPHLVPKIKGPEQVHTDYSFGGGGGGGREFKISEGRECSDKPDVELLKPDRQMKQKSQSPMGLCEMFREWRRVVSVSHFHSSYFHAQWGPNPLKKP